MKTAELIKKRKEGQTNPVQPQVHPVFERQSTTMGDNEGFSTPVETVSEQINPVSLYEDGKSKPETTRTTPLTKEDTDRFYSTMFKPEDFGVETEEQRNKRERADFIKLGLTGLTEGLSALANLYYTTKGAPSQKYTSQMPALQERLYRERLERDKKLENFRAWQRAKAEQADERAYNLHMFNVKQEAANKAAERQAKIDAQAAEIKYYRDLGLIDAKKAADLEKLIGKARLDNELEVIRAKNAKDLEALRQKNRIELKQTSSASDDKVVESVQVGETVYTRNTKLSDSQLRILAKYNQHPEEFTTKEADNIATGQKGKETFDLKGAAFNAIESGSVPVSVLKQMGFKEGKSYNDIDNKPPSRRENDNKDNDNVPPSRRK